MTLEARSFFCFVWTGTPEALMSETNKCFAKKVKRNIDVGYPLSDAEAWYLIDPLVLFVGKRMLCGRNRITIEQNNRKVVVIIREKYANRVSLC
ncbi:Uncharacterized protein APZ42_018816 [Daphnia magna]|uniref:Uncharacterized protein n=1 Tax=Daphnia magna TaxID=35525 RepID=A0A164YU98_9CRUS|nr:Uncharacterized protein APZ42_018816 [Daphnia magna]